MDEKDFELFEIEAKEKWGSTNAYNEYADKTSSYSFDNWHCPFRFIGYRRIL